MNYSRITKLSMAISLALAGANVSAVDIDAPVAVNYATETVASALLSGTAPCSLSITGKVGVLIPGSGATSTITRYLRFDLTGDAKFAGTTPSMAAIGTATITQVSGGSGFNFVIFSVATAINTPVAATDIFTLTVPSIAISDTETPVQLNYSVHTNDVSASQGLNGTAVEKASSNISYITYSSGLVFGVTPSNLTASVEANFGEFSSSSNATATQGSLGQLNFAASPVCGPTGTTIGLSELLDTATTLEFVGDFNLIQDVAADGTGLGTFGDTTTTGVQNGAVNFFDNATCTTGAVLSPTTDITIASDGSQVTFSGVVAGALDGKYLCLVRPTGSIVKILPDDTYELNLKPVSGNGFTVAPVTAPTGDVLRDGTVLESPYFTLTPGYISRFMLSHLNPTGADAAFTIELQTDEGNVITPNAAGPFPYDATEKTFSGTLAAGTILQINATDLVTSFSAKNRGSATFTFVASNNDIQGIYQAVNLATGEISNLPLPRPGGGNGK